MERCAADLMVMAGGSLSEVVADLLVIAAESRGSSGSSCMPGVVVVGVDQEAKVESYHRRMNSKFHLTVVYIAVKVE